MTMSSSTLASALASVANSSSEASAIAALSSAFSSYFDDAQALTTITPAGVALGNAAFQSALVGVNAPGQGAAKIRGAVMAFWSAVVGGLATSFTGATAIVAPFLALTTSELQAVFDANRSSSLSTAASANSIASVIHARSIGGSVTTPGPVTTVII